MEKQIKLIAYVGHDYWSRANYRLLTSDTLLIDISCGIGERDLHASTSNIFDEGEPDYSVEDKYDFIEVSSIVDKDGNNLDVSIVDYKVTFVQTSDDLIE